MTISVRLNDSEAKLFKHYAEMNNISISELVRQAVLEKIEMEYDLKLYNEAMAEFEKDPVTYSHDEVKKILELD